MVFTLQIANEDATLFFRDGIRKIDYVLAYQPGTSDQEEKKRERRKLFEDNLRAEGLDLEYEGKEVKEQNFKIIYFLCWFEVL